jgi:hypothetical protein
MFNRWDKEFDRVCGANITCQDSAPLEDSGVWDILYGMRETSLDSENLAEQPSDSFDPPLKF